MNRLMKSKIWKIPYSRPTAPRELIAAGYSPLLAAVLNLRGITTAAEADRLIRGNESCLHDPMLMKGMPAAVNRLRRAIDTHETVAVYGDYDVDGITSTCVVTDYLRSKGLYCIPYIPDRSGEGYGVNNDALDKLHAQGVTLVVTVDCGITAVAETEYAAELGMDMLITDHHECPSGALPAAAAVVDCKQDGDEYPNKELAGVGVALKLVCACEGDSTLMLERYADLAAVGTVADVMPLVDENRYLVRCGLKKLETSPRPGIAAMLREASVDGKKLTATTIGFSIAPRLNAAGRLGQAMTAAKLLMTQDTDAANALAAELCELNRKRQSIETDIWQEANAILAGKTPDAPIVLASDHWHQGVIGIAASRLAEQYSLPAIMICLNGENGKGSCRSYGGFNLFEALSACASHLTGFGGHALAAGLNINRSEVDAFRSALAEYYRANRPAAEPEVQCDMLISDPSMLSIDSVRSLDLLEPYGNANPRPTFCVFGAELDAADAVGGGRHMRMRVRLRKERFEAIFFSHTAAELGLHVGERVDLAFTPQINEFRGHVSVQFVVSDARPHDGAELCAAILSGDDSVLWAAAPFCPDRMDFVRIWRGAQLRGFKAADDAAGIIAQTPRGMEPERFCICLMVLLEVGLLTPGPGGGIFGAAPKLHIVGKADLEAARMIRILKSL